MVRTFPNLMETKTFKKSGVRWLYRFSEALMKRDNQLNQ